MYREVNRHGIAILVMFPDIIFFDEASGEVVIWLSILQGSHKLWKSWKTWKITKKSSMHGIIMEFEKPE